MIALQADPDAWDILILDSDAADNGRLFDTLRSRNEWHPPSGVTVRLRESVFWMVEIMESWFLADVPALKDYYGKGFRERAIPEGADVEIIPKQEVYRRLDEATKGTKIGCFNECARSRQKAISELSSHL